MILRGILYFKFSTKGGVAVLIRRERFVRFAAQRLVRALTRSDVRVSNPAFVHLVGVAARANDGEVSRLVSGEPLFIRYEQAFRWRKGSMERAVILEEVGDAAPAVGLLVGAA
jgi:hypothetical protein